MTSFFQDLFQHELNLKLEILQALIFSFVNVCCTCRYVDFKIKLYFHAYSINSFDVFYSAFFVGSFKIRGVANQMASLPEEVKSGEKKLITMSAGNYGKAFAYTLDKISISGLCLLPLSAPFRGIALFKVHTTTSSV